MEVNINDTTLLLQTNQGTSLILVVGSIPPPLEPNLWEADGDETIRPKPLEGGEPVKVSVDYILNGMDDRVYDPANRAEPVAFESDLDDLRAITTPYPAVSFEVIQGGAVTGTIEAVQNANDGNTLRVNESAGGLTVDFTFSGVQAFNVISLHMRYAGGANHQWEIQLWNYTTNGWDIKGETEGTQDYLTWFNIVVPEDNQFLNNGAVKVRFYHLPNFITAHFVLFDYVAVVATLTAASPATATAIENDSNVGGASVKEALNNLLTYIQDLAPAISIDSLTYEVVGEEAIITAIASGGIGTLSYTLNGVTTTTGIFAVTESGTYTVSVTDEIASSVVTGDVEVLIDIIQELTNAYISHVESLGGVADFVKVYAIYEEITQEAEYDELTYYWDFNAGKKLAEGYADEYDTAYSLIYPYTAAPFNGRFSVDENGKAVCTSGSSTVAQMDMRLLNAESFNIVVRAKVFIPTTMSAHSTYSILRGEDTLSINTMLVRSNRVPWSQFTVQREGSPTTLTAISSQTATNEIVVLENLASIENLEHYIKVKNATVNNNPVEGDIANEIGNNIAGKSSITIYQININPFYFKYYKKKTRVERFNTWIQTETTDNDVDNYAFDETRNFTPRYLTNAFICPSPMNATIQRKAFSNIYKFGEYAFLVYQAGSKHSPNALSPWSLEFVRSNDLFKTRETLKVKCINDSGTMREIVPNTDGIFPIQIMLVEANGKIYGIIAVFRLTQLPPVSSTDWDNYKTYITYTEDYGDTWAELNEIDANDTYAAGGRPIVVGNEIWYPSYSTGNALSGLVIADLHSYVLKYNYTTGVTTKNQIDDSWIGLSTTEPAILEYATGKYICVARVNWNANFEGAELNNKGMVIAYSSDGEDWSDYEFLNWGNQFPNQPKLFMYKDIVYITNANVMYHGTPSLDGSRVDWIIKSVNPDWRLQHGYVMMAYEATTGGIIQRKDPREGKETDLINLTRVGGLDMCVWDEEKETIFATIGYHNDVSGIYLAEPWVGIIKRNMVKADGTATKRLIFMTEIPGDSDTSNTITIHNSYVLETDTIVAKWEDSANMAISLVGAWSASGKITFTAGAPVTQARIVYELIRA
jgi:hypothetical protein